MKPYYQDEWWSPGQIVFTRKQVIFLLRNLNDIKLGYWPSEHKNTGYSGGKSKPCSHSAPYERTMQVLAELEQRIEHAGDDGLWLELVYSNHDHYFDMAQHIANAKHLDIKMVERSIESALKYICGKCRKWVNCIDCIEYKSCQRKKRVGRDYKTFKSHKKRRPE